MERAATIGTRERAVAETAKDASRQCNAGRAGAHRPSEALHPTRPSDVLTRIARERVPCLLETCYKDAPDSRESAPLPRFSRPGKRGAGETVASHGAF